MNAAVTWLHTSPLTGLLLTLLAYRLAVSVNRRCRGNPLSNSVLVAVLLVVAALQIGGIRYDEYMQGARFIHLLLGPATVALAIPLYDNLARLKRAGGALALTLFGGGLIGIVSGTVLGRAMGLPRQAVLSLMPRSVTTPIAMGVAESIGGIPALAAALVILTGIVGAVMVRPLLYRFGLKDDRVLGFATGIAAHGVGTARAFQLSETAGAFAGLAMGLNGLLTPVLVPMLVGWLVA
ncbi:LrgB family protein [Paludibacterium yongneupense]|uniref:LrgB family protein n=1 Tax=Paludibacterium yongneupense TaxID=400061 RepID=UPI0004195B50|nr:LrgB family protein [Paludibacterium yongneupense]